MWNQKTKLCDDQGLMSSLAENFLMEKPKRTRFGNFRIKDDSLVYESVRQTRERDEKTGEYKTETLTDIVAIKFMQDGKRCYIGNSSILSLIGAEMHYGNESKNNRVTVIQRVLERMIPMVPFSALEQAKLDVRKTRFVERGNAEVIKRKVITEKYDYKSGKNIKTTSVEYVHFTGASLLKVDGSYFLFDVDRREIKHQIFNPFLAEIPGKPKSIAEAYELLKPKAVKDAEKKGLEVLRQGEWFFIKTKAPKLPKLSTEDILSALTLDGMWGNAKDLLIRTIGKDAHKKMVKRAKQVLNVLPRRFTLKAGENRPNHAQLGVVVNGETLVSGYVEHSGREHAKLVLNGWYKAIPNTAIKSVTVTGDID